MKLVGNVNEKRCSQVEVKKTFKVMVILNIKCFAGDTFSRFLTSLCTFFSISLFLFLCNIHIIVPHFRESVGTLNLIRPSVCLSVTKTLTLAITFALLQIELSYLACVFLVTRPFRWYHVVTLTVTFNLLQGQICCRAGDHNSLNLLVLNGMYLRILIFCHTFCNFADC